MIAVRDAETMAAELEQGLHHSYYFPHHARADLAKHVQRRLVGAAMGRAPKRSDARGDAGERIGP